MSNKITNNLGGLTGYTLYLFSCSKTTEQDAAPIRAAFRITIIKTHNK
jgi:hypothetical protein